LIGKQGRRVFVISNAHASMYIVTSEVSGDFSSHGAVGDNIVPISTKALLPGSAGRCPMIKVVKLSV
jgi:hypothetical protein